MIFDDRVISLTVINEEGIRIDDFHISALVCAYNLVVDSAESIIHLA